MQVTGVVADPDTVSCARGGPAATEATYSIMWDLEIVNTTAQDVTVNNVSSTGSVIRGTDPADLGQPAHVFGALPIADGPVVVPAKGGHVTMEVGMTAGCGSGSVPAQYYRDIETTLRVTTSSGQLSATPTTIHVVWQPAA